MFIFHYIIFITNGNTLILLCYNSNIGNIIIY